MKKDKQDKKTTEKEKATRAQSIELVAHWALAALNKIINLNVTKEQVPIEQEKKRFYDDLSASLTRAFRKDAVQADEKKETLEKPSFETEIVTDWEATAKAMRAIAETAISPLSLLFKDDGEKK